MSKFKSKASEFWFYYGDLIVKALAVVVVVLGVVSIFVAASAAYACVVWLLWNKLVVSLTGWRTFTFLQVWGLLFLLSLIRKMVFGSRSSTKSKE